MALSAVGSVPSVSVSNTTFQLDLAQYLSNVFRDDPDFRQAADNWATEEVQHGDALGKWAMLADPSWDYAAAFERYRNG